MTFIKTIRNTLAERKAKKRRRQERSFHSGSGGGATHRAPDAPGARHTGVDQSF